MTQPLLEVRDLIVRLRTSAGLVTVVDGVSLKLERSGVLGVVGESGSGKSVTMRAVFGLLPRGAIVKGSVKFEGRELLGLSDSAWRKYRGRSMSDHLPGSDDRAEPGADRWAQQIVEAIRIHDRSVSHRVAIAARGRPAGAGRPSRIRRCDGSRNTRTSSPAACASALAIAMSMANDPQVLLVADEPTTALDVTVQAQIMDVLRRLSATRKGVGHHPDHPRSRPGRRHRRAQVAVMYAGRVVEQGAARTRLFARLTATPIRAACWPRCRSMQIDARGAAVFHPRRPAHAKRTDRPAAPFILAAIAEACGTLPRSVDPPRCDLCWATPSDAVPLRRSAWPTPPPIGSVGDEHAA